MRMGMIALMLVALLAAGCDENQMTASVLTGQDTDLSVRAGVINDGTEVFGTIKYGIAGDVDWQTSNIDQAGIGVIFHLTQEVTIEDTPDASLIQPWLEALNARPFAGVELVANVDANEHFSDMRPVWIVGTAFTLSDDAKTSLNVEYVDGDRVAGDVNIGIQHKF